MDRTNLNSLEEWHVSPPETLSDTSIVIDGENNRFEAVVHFNGNTSLVWIDKWTESGVKRGSWAVRPPTRSTRTKLDSCSLAILGSDLLVSITAHDLDNRDYIKGMARIEGVANR